MATEHTALLTALVVLSSTGSAAQPVPDLYGRLVGAEASWRRHPGVRFDGDMSGTGVFPSRAQVRIERIPDARPYEPSLEDIESRWLVRFDIRVGDTLQATYDGASARLLMPSETRNGTEAVQDIRRRFSSYIHWFESTAAFSFPAMSPEGTLRTLGSVDVSGGVCERIDIDPTAHFGPAQGKPRAAYQVCLDAANVPRQIRLLRRTPTDGGVTDEVILSLTLSNVRFDPPVDPWKRSGSR